VRRVACVAFIVALLAPGLGKAAETASTDARVGLEGTYRSMGTDAEIRVRLLSGDTYYLIASDGWEGIGMLDHGVYRGVYHYNAPRDSTQRGVTGTHTIDVTGTNELRVRTSVTRRNGESTDVWRLVDKSSAPVPMAAIRVQAIPPYEQNPLLDEPPEPVRVVKPEYPQAALKAGVDGTVVVGAYVLGDGSVADVRVVQSIAMLDSAAVAAVRQWRFERPHRNGTPVSAWVTVPVKFRVGGP
jgi:TonB family protein